MAALALSPVAGYPASSSTLVILQDGASVLLRPATPADSERLQRMFSRLSPETVYRWCFLPALNLSHWMETIANVTNIDYPRQHVMVASYAGEIVGIARYDCTTTNQEAELGIVLEDTWQGRRLGKLLLGQMILAASRQQITRFIAVILGENRPALRLVASLFDKLTIHWLSGECQVSASLEDFKPPVLTSRFSAENPGRSLR